MTAKDPSPTRTIHPLYLEATPITTSKRVELPKIKEWNARGFCIESFMSRGDCTKIINAAKEIAQKNGNLENLAAEYPPEYRSSNRLLISAPELAAYLYQKLLTYLKASDIDGIRPYGLINEGVWKPAKLNHVFKISQYKTGNEFKPHRDGAFVESNQIRSVFTVLIYLNCEYSGGNTEFYYKNDSFQFDRASLGSALIFNHDLKHAGLPVQWGEKFVMKTELIFSNLSETQFNTAYNEILALYLKSDELESKGNVQEATEAYLQAIAIQAKNKSVPPKAPEVSIANDATITLPSDTLVHILTFLPLKVVLQVCLVSKRWGKLARNETVWMELFKRFPFDAEAVDSYKQSLEKPAFLSDWYFLFKRIYISELNPVLVIELGPKVIRLTGVNKTPVEIPNVVVHTTKRTGGHHNILRNVDICGHDTEKCSPREYRIYPMRMGKLNEDSQRAIIQWVMRFKLRLWPSRCIIAEPAGGFAYSPEQWNHFAFVKMTFSALYTAPAPVFAMRACNKESGISVDCGSQLDLSEPIFLAPVMHKQLIKQNVRRIENPSTLSAEIHTMIEKLKEHCIDIASNVVLYNTAADKVLSLLDPSLQQLAILASKDPAFAVVEGACKHAVEGECVFRLAPKKTK